MGSQTHMVWENGRLGFYRDLANRPCSALYLNMCLNPIVCSGSWAHKLRAGWGLGPCLRLSQYYSLLRCKTALYSLNQSPVNLALLNYDISYSYIFLFFPPFFFLRFFSMVRMPWWVQLVHPQPGSEAEHQEPSPSCPLHWPCCPANVKTDGLLGRTTKFCPQYFCVCWWNKNRLGKVLCRW